MKKIDTFYLSDKQIAQLKSKKAKKNAVRGAIFFLTALACGLTVGFLPPVLQNFGIGPESIESVKNVLTGISGTGVIGAALSVIKATSLVDDPKIPKDHVVDTREDNFYGRSK